MSRLKSFTLKFMSVVFILLMSSVSVYASSKNPNTDWLMDAKYGVFVHYLYGEHDMTGDWNDTVNAFDVNTFANQMEQAGAGYVIFTLGQGSGYYCAPNTVYDSYTGHVAGERCSNRDLINDLYTALNSKGIKLILYSSGDGPFLDSAARSNLNWDGNAGSAFRTKWFNIHKEWSDRYGSKIAGWWIDGCGYTPYTSGGALSDFEAALKSGNPNALVAFNPQIDCVQPYSMGSGHEDYTAGEINYFNCVPTNRWLNDEQWHVLNYLGTWWGEPSCRYSNQEVIDYVKACNENQGVVSLDVAVYRNGTISSVQLNQFIALKQALIDNRSKNYAYNKPSQLLSNVNNTTLPSSNDHYAYKATDGYSSTYAQAAFEYAWTLQTDLQEVKTFNNIVIKFAPDRYATDYEVNVSSDGLNWMTVQTVTGCTGGRREHTFSPVNARYLRIKAVKPDASGQTGGQMGITELEIYNTNLAFNKSSQLLSNINGATLSPSNNHYASGATDGDASSWAQAAYEYAWTLQTDLEEVKTFNNIVIKFAPDRYATEYEIKISTDGVSWTTTQSVSGCTGGTKVHTYTPVNARYIRVRAIKPDGPGQTGGQMGIAELEVYNTNLAFNKPSQLLSNINGTTLPSSNDHYASEATDGDTSTWAQAATEYAWTLQTDLLVKQTFNNIVIKFEPNLYATEYEIKVSADGENWTTIQSITGCTGGSKVHTFSAVDARFIRVKAIKPDGFGQTGGQMGIEELEIYYN